MSPNAIRFFSVLFAALALVPAGAHVLEIVHKMRLAAEEYLVVQQLYRGWALTGVFVAGAFLSSLGLVLMERHRPEVWRLALIGFACIVATQLIFWTFTFPVNRATLNWTILPSDWQALRLRWEYSHAASAGFNLAALLALIGAVLPRSA